MKAVTMFTVKTRCSTCGISTGNSRSKTFDQFRAQCCFYNVLFLTLHQIAELGNTCSLIMNVMKTEELKTEQLKIEELKTEELKTNSSPVTHSTWVWCVHLLLGPSQPPWVSDRGWVSAELLSSKIEDVFETTTSWTFLKQVNWLRQLNRSTLFV